MKEQIIGYIALMITIVVTIFLLATYEPDRDGGALGRAITKNLTEYHENVSTVSLNVKEVR